MKDIKALFIDCDGVLYDKAQCTYHDIVEVGLHTTMQQLHLSKDEYDQIRQDLKKRGIRGVFNTVLALCQKYHHPFDLFAAQMVGHTDYTRISPDATMLTLLKKVAKIIPTYIVTNNSAPHLNKIFSCLNKGIPVQDIQDEFGLHVITIEKTFNNGVFHSKKMPQQLTNLCTQVGEKTENVLLLDDSNSVLEAAIEQGLQVVPIQKPTDTKTILRRVIHENTKPQRIVSIRKTCGRSGR